MCKLEAIKQAKIAVINKRLKSHSSVEIDVLYKGTRGMEPHQLVLCDSVLDFATTSRTGWQSWQVLSIDGNIEDVSIHSSATFCNDYDLYLNLMKEMC